jgi:carboxyl-terminal processing protease
MLNNLGKMAKEAGIEFTREDVAQSREVLKNRIKAWVARSAYGKNGYFPIINEDNEVFQRAMQLFDKAEELASR